MSNNKQTAVEWLYKELAEILCNVEVNAVQAITLFDRLKQAKEMEKEQKNNLPIHIHEGISNTHVYIENGIVHVKPNKQTQTTENGKSNN